MNETARDRARETGPALEAHNRFLLWLVPAVERFPRSRKFLLGDRIQKTALDILESLVEATYTKRRAAHPAHANLGLEKLRFLFRLARDLRYLEQDASCRSTQNSVRRHNAEERISSL